MIDLGTGIAFSLSVGNEGGIATASGLDHLRQSIGMILMTKKGERIMRPWFGSDLWKYLDYPINQSTLASMRYEIYTALKEETRIQVTAIRITSPEPQWLVFNVECLIENNISVAVQISYDRENQRWEGICQESGSLSSS